MSLREFRLVHRDNPEGWNEMEDGREVQEGGDRHTCG